MTKLYSILSFLLILFSIPSRAQYFVQVQNSAITNPGLDDYWTGAAWVDIDNDQDLDLFLTNRVSGNSPRKNKLYINQNGTFSLQNTGILVSDYGYWFGTSWGDVNNDSLIDVFVAGYPSKLYLNQGNGNFQKVSQGAIASSTLSGIGAAMGDLNNDGYLDIVLVRPNWLQGPPGTGFPGSPKIMINSGPPLYTFGELQGTDVSTNGADTYLHPTLSDYDDDGDQDLFIGMGSGAPKPDLLYENTFSSSGQLGYSKMTTNTLALDSVEGNQWSFVDIDNDLDLDAYLTNWANVVNGINIPRPNTLYVNQNNAFTKVSRGDITSDLELTSTVSWGDYDNDKDLDAIVVSDSGYTLSYYQNDGTGNFTAIAAGAVGGLDEHQSGASNGDYDNDGDLDIFIPGPGSHAAFLRNDLSNGFNWVQFDLRGTSSNYSGIGAKVYVKSGGSWQMREVSASSVFFGMNSLRQHFGLANDSLELVRVKWPSGIVETFDSLKDNTIHRLVEGTGILSATGDLLNNPRPKIKAYPNPSRGIFRVRVDDLPTDFREGRIEVLNTMGRCLESIEYKKGAVDMELSPGLYILRFISAGTILESRLKLIVV